MNITLFLGAGFSAPFGHPVMNNFLDNATAGHRIEDQEKQFLDRLILEARRANGFLENSTVNLEHILSFAVMGDRLGLYRETGEPKAVTLKKILQRIYTSYRETQKYWSQFSILSNFLGFDLGENRHKLSFITTNYDINIESALNWLRVYCNPGFDLKHAQRKGSGLYSKNGIMTFKLHGSVNWFEKNDGHLIIDEQDVTVWPDPNKVETYKIPAVCANDYAFPGNPLIVPPSFLKPDLSGVLEGIWSGAAKTLKETDRVVFIGYSFPESDKEMMYFLATSFADNPRLRKIQVIDPIATQIVTRLRRPEGNVGYHFKELLEPINIEWENYQLNVG